MSEILFIGFPAFVKNAVSKGSSSSDLIERVEAPLEVVKETPFCTADASEKKVKSIRMDSSSVRPSVAGASLESDRGFGESFTEDSEDKYFNKGMCLPTKSGFA